MSFKYPFPIFVYPTLFCNFTCSYCFNFSGPSKVSNSFILDAWDDFLSACACLQIPEIRISGGEPLLLSDLQQRCQAIVDHGMRYTILSNGSLLERNLNWLSHAPPETLWISYHHEFSSETMFARRVGRAAQALPRVGIHVFSRDVARQPQLVNRAVQAGAQRIKILNLTPIGRCGESDQSERWTGEELHAMRERWQELSARVLEVRIAVPLWTDSIAGEETCVLRERPLLSVNHDGMVYPCCVTLGIHSTAIGNLQRETLEVIASRTNGPSRQLPCQSVLPSISHKKSACPLRLLTAGRESMS